MMIREMLINSLRGKITNAVRALPAGRHAHGAQEPRHIWKYVKVTNPDISYPGAARHIGDGDSPAQRINQCFLSCLCDKVLHQNLSEVTNGYVGRKF